MCKRLFFRYLRASLFNIRSLTNLLWAINMQHSNRKRMSRLAHTIASKITFFTEKHTTRHAGIHLYPTLFRYARRVFPNLSTHQPSLSSPDKNAKLFFVMLSLHLSCHVSFLLLFCILLLERNSSIRLRLAKSISFWLHLSQFLFLLFLVATNNASQKNFRTLFHKQTRLQEWEEA